MAQSTDPSVVLAKAVAHPLRVRILNALEGTTSSPNRLSEDLNEPLGNVSYHVKTLLEFGCVELVKTEPRRGAVEHFYRASKKGALLVAKPLKLNDTQRGLLVEVLDNVLDNDKEKFTYSERDQKAIGVIREAVKP